MPSSTGCAVLGSPPAATVFAFSSSYLKRSNQLAGQELRVARLVNANLAEHLPNDHLDVLVVDGHRLAGVDLLHLRSQVLLHRTLTLDRQQVLRADRPSVS